MAKQQISSGQALHASVIKLSVHEGLLMTNNTIVIPKPLQAETLIAIHSEHQGIIKCRECAKHSVW